MVRRWGAGLLLGFAAVAAGGAGPDAGLTRFEFAEPHMGTTFRLVFYAPDAATAKRAAAAGFARIAELNKALSDYDPDSELMRLCKQAGGPPVPVGPDLFAVVQAAVKYAERSDGALDPSIGPVVRLWRLARRTRQLPPAAEIKRALDLVDYRKIRLDPNGRTVQLLLAGMILDLGGIAKGYTADAVLAVLRRHGITRALVAAGGDVAVADPPPGAAGWKVGIAPLRDPGAAPTHTLLLANAAVSTAGDANQYAEVGGKRYSHIVDPKTGLGQVGRRSVTVIAPDGLTSDALDTAAAVLGRDRGRRLIEGHPGAAGLLVFETEGGVEETPTGRFAKYRHPDTPTK